MKLQIKDSGAWRNVATFTTPAEPMVRTAAALLLRALNQPNTALRIAEGDSPLDWCEAPSFAWRNQAAETKPMPAAPAARPADAPATGPAAMTPAQVHAAFLEAACDVDVEPTDEEIVDLLCTNFGMSRTQVIRRIDQFNFVKVVSAQPAPVAA